MKTFLSRASAPFPDAMDGIQCLNTRSSARRCLLILASLGGLAFLSQPLRGADDSVVAVFSSVSKNYVVDHGVLGHDYRHGRHVQLG